MLQAVQVSIGRFHHFHLARQLEKHQMLNSIYTGFPKFKLKEEQGIPQEKIHAFPWLQAPYMYAARLGVNKLNWLNKEWCWLASQSLDQHVKSNLSSPVNLIALSGSGLYCGTYAQQLGGNYICDRGSSHIRYQNDILTEEYKRWGFVFEGVDPRVIDKEESEYRQSDYITVPSEFVKQSFIEQGIHESKIKKIPYGARLDRFYKTSDPALDEFNVLWVGGVSIRKGFMYALKAFQKLKHPAKKFTVIGNVSEEIKALLLKENLNNIDFISRVENKELIRYYNLSHAFVLSSIEEGLAMVQGEALSCGCPLIVTNNTGGGDLFDDGKEGFIIPIRNENAIWERLQLFADNKMLRDEMSNAALNKVSSIGGWDTYGDQYSSFLKTIIRKS
ncbi:glycosyltransferase family 4 protein [Cytophaga aurantiaca]|uniref:glycosyltransferase family 4 protein n=1 Tax=Cytophaga aurantiaca TaxID=29530 RepID=UPI00047767D9|nr:glycosyltransferase family 4 protein [Cytophaga aurantiaca]